MFAPLVPIQELNSAVLWEMIVIQSVLLAVWMVITLKVQSVSNWMIIAKPELKNP